MSIKTLFFLLLLCSMEVLGSALPQHWKRVGEAELTVLWFKIYHAQLLSPDGHYPKVKQSLILKLNYHRNISQQDLLQETRQQMDKFAPKDQTEPWLMALLKILPDIRKGDQLTFWIDHKSTGHFYHNKHWIGSLPDPAFSETFIKIWLSEKSSYPYLAKKLRGNSNQ